MKSIKLISLVSFGYLLIFVLLLILTFGVFIRFLKVGVNESIDEILINRQQNVVALLEKSTQEVPLSRLPFPDYYVYPLSRQEQEFQVYRDTLIVDNRDQEPYIYRMLSSVKQVHGTPYRIDILLPLIEEEDVIDSLMIALLLVFVSVLGIFYLSSQFLSKRIFTSFNTILQRLKDFEVARSSSYLPVHSRIDEFNHLNHSLVELASKAHLTFSNQKQFIENASHELLTPISVTQHKLEELAGDPDLTYQQSQTVQVLLNVNQRMSRLNQTLLLLSKIENKQYPETQEILLKSLIIEILILFEDQIHAMELQVAVEISDQVTVMGNGVLLDLLLTNLIKNAIVHNFKKGQIIIQFLENLFVISNTGITPEIPQDAIFKRFYKNSMRQESWGLGLAMVKNICQVEHWNISYAYTSGIHVFRIFFTSAK